MSEVPTVAINKTGYVSIT